MAKLNNLNLIIEFGGGAELLFGNVKKHKVKLSQEESSTWTIRKLLPWIQKNLLKERPELFIQDESVRPGILVLVNDADWELLLVRNVREMICEKIAEERKTNFQNSLRHF